jgi:hypothetical protein
MFQPKSWPSPAPEGPKKAVPTITPAYVQLWIPRGANPATLTCIEPSFWPWPCHYWERRTRPCTRSKGHCAACDAGQAARLTAWIAAFLRTSAQRVILQITQGALAGCPDLWHNDGRLYGRILTARRRHNGPQAPMEIGLLPMPCQLQLPASLNTLKILSAVWGMSTELLRELIATDLPSHLDSRFPPTDNGQP